MPHEPNLQTPMLDVLYDQGPCLVVNKPCALLTQAAQGIDSLETRVREFWMRREHKTDKIYVGVVHRLDRPVSGAVIFARHVRAARRLSRQLEGRTVQKKYAAIVAGIPTETSGRLTHHLRKVPGRAFVEIARSDEPGAQAAELKYRVLAKSAGAALLDIEPLTGRTHQIRVQLANIGCPILGDVQYGSPTEFGPTHADPRDCPIALHGYSVAFRHPTIPTDVIVHAPFPPLWSSQQPQLYELLAELAGRDRARID